MKIQPGDIVDIVAPSSPPKGTQWEKGLQILHSWGLKPRLQTEAIKPWLFHSHTNQKRSYYLNQAFLNKESSSVWMLRGGYGLQKLLPSFIKNYRRFKKKLFIGYSDATALHLYLNSKKQKTLHAPMICDLPNLSQKELITLKHMILGVHKEITLKKLTSFQRFSGKATVIKAPILGGNLSLLSSCVGLSWMPSLSSCFLFIEEVNEDDYKVDRMLHHLLYSGTLKGVKALLLGQFHPLKKKSLIQVFKSFFEVCKIPIVFGLPCGHKTPNNPLPLNTLAALSIMENQAILKVSAGK